MALFGAMQMEEARKGEGLLVHNSACTTSLGTKKQTGLESKKRLGRLLCMQMNESHPSYRRKKLQPRRKKTRM